MIKYSFLNKRNYQKNNYSLVPLRKKDIQLIRKWRNKQIEFLRQSKYISTSEQIHYYEKVIKKTFNQNKPKQILFSFLYCDDLIGYGGLTNINWKSKICELSFLVSPERYQNKLLYRKDFTNFLKMIFEIAFEKGNLNQIFTETYDVRPNHIAILEKFNFIINKRKENHVIINFKKVDSLIHIYTRSIDGNEKFEKNYN